MAPPSIVVKIDTMASFIPSEAPVPTTATSANITTEPPVLLWGDYVYLGIFAALTLVIAVGLVVKIFRKRFQGGHDLDHSQGETSAAVNNAYTDDENQRYTDEQSEVKTKM